MPNPDISVIIPVFNAEKTLKKSINSILRQTAPKLEIICIDDGSADTSIEQIESMRARHPQIRLLRQEHGGAGPARNLGIQSAKGKYIVFLDADDEFVDPDALNQMVRACSEHHAYICGSYRIASENGEEQVTELFKDYIVPEEGRFIRYSDFQYDYDYQSFIYDRKFLMQNDIWFPPYMRYQDPPFFVKAMAAAERFYVMPVVLYKYWYDPSKYSIVTKYVDHILQGMIDTLEIARDRGYRELFGNIVDRVECQFRDAILQNLSERSMSLLTTVEEMSFKFQGKRLKVLFDIYRGMENTGKLIDSHDLLRKIVLAKQKEKGFQAYFEQHGIRTAAVYGLGAYGEILVNELELCGVTVVCGIDREVMAYGNLPVIRPEDKVPECDALIISLMNPEEIMCRYKAAGNITVYTFIQIIHELADFCRP